MRLRLKAGSANLTKTSRSLQDFFSVENLIVWTGRATSAWEIRDVITWNFYHPVHHRGRFFDLFSVSMDVRGEAGGDCEEGGRSAASNGTRDEQAVRSESAQVWAGDEGALAEDSETDGKKHDAGESNG
jgi:hypothetical protein